MTAQPKSREPIHRMGLYKCLDEVPDHHRLERYKAAYDGRDVWNEFVESRSGTFDSDHYLATFRKAGQSWTDHTVARGRHHALGRPVDVDTWCATLTETRTHLTVYKEYLLRLEDFYTWLQFHVDHPHVYHPVLMAAHEHDLTRSLWDQKFRNKDRGGSQ